MTYMPTTTLRECDVDRIEPLADKIVAERRPPKPPKPPRPPKVKRVVQTHNEKRLLVMSALKVNTHGLTKSQIMAMTGISDDGVEGILMREHGYSIYIDHWSLVRSRWRPVYALCDCPPDEPKPSAKGKTR